MRDIQSRAADLPQPPINLDGSLADPQSGPKRETPMSESSQDTNSESRYHQLSPVVPVKDAIQRVPSIVISRSKHPVLTEQSSASLEVCSISWHNFENYIKIFTCLNNSLRILL